MPPEPHLDLPAGKELTARWVQLSRPVQGELWRKLRRGDTSEEPHEAFLIAAMARQRLHDWTMRPEIVLPVFLAVLFLMSLVIDGFSFASSLPAPLVYAAYMFWMRGTYTRSYRRSAEVLERNPTGDA